ncbi:MAG: FHA domain-containing protein FhaB/FipA [Propionibacteriaceae bacterium]
MGDLVIIGVKIGFLILLWLFVLIVARVIRTDLSNKPSDADSESAPKKQKRASQVNAIPRALAIIEGRQAGLEVGLTHPIDIGRNPTSTLVLDDDYVSTRHATLQSDGDGGFYVEDFGSTNGTFINEHRITAPTSFGLQDTLRIGQTVMKLVS